MINDKHDCIGWKVTTCVTTPVCVVVNQEKTQATIGTMRAILSVQERCSNDTALQEAYWSITQTSQLLA